MITPNLHRSAIFLLIAFAACDDPPVGPPGPPAHLEIDEQDTISVGASVVLDRTVRDDDGRIIDNALVSWGSLNEHVATVDQSGTLHAVRPGVTRIHASAGTGADSTWVVVRSDCSGLEVIDLEGHGYQWTVFLPGSTEGALGPGRTTDYYGDPMFFGSGFTYGVHADSTLVGNGYYGSPQDFLLDACRLDELAPFHSIALLEPDGSSQEQHPVRSVGVVQEAFAFEAESDNDYILYRVTFTNMRSLPVTIRSGMDVDFDLYGRENDVGGADPLTGTVWVAAVDSLENSLMGGLLVEGRAITSYRQGPPGSPTRSMYFEWLGETTIEDAAATDDVRQVIGVQPFTIEPGQSTELWYALVAGPDRAAFEVHAEAAREKIRELSAASGLRSARR